MSDYVGEFEEAVMLSVYRLRDNAYSVTVQEDLAGRLEKSASLGMIYTTLKRLENRGFVKSKLGDPTSERGGRPKRLFWLTGAGATALNNAKNRRKLMWNDIKAVEVAG